MFKKDFLVDLSIYPIEAVYGAAYVFIDRVYIFLEMNDDKVQVNFTAKNNTAKEDLDEIIGEFQNELLNYTLRISLEKNNKKIRERIVERALYSSVGEEDDIWDDDDPLGLLDEDEDENENKEN